MEAQYQTIIDKLSRIERGLYGDEENGQLGLISRHEDTHERLKKHEEEVDKRLDKLENKTNRTIWYGVGFIGGVQAIWYWLKN